MFKKTDTTTDHYYRVELLKGGVVVRVLQVATYEDLMDLPHQVKGQCDSFRVTDVLKTISTYVFEEGVI